MQSRALGVRDSELSMQEKLMLEREKSGVKALFQQKCNMYGQYAKMAQLMLLPIYLLPCS